MTLLTIVQALSKNVGVKAPSIVATSPARGMVEALQMANEAGEELARRVDWGALQENVVLTGTGANIMHDLGASFSRLNKGVAVRAGTAIVRPLTRAEWNTLTPVEGVPRYFLLEGNKLTLWPYLANAATVTAQFQSLNWCSAGTSFMADTDTSLLDEGLLTKGLIARWRRQKGMDFADYEAEYEASLRDFAGFDDRSRL